MPSINENCKLCPLWEGATTVCVAGQGPKDAKIMLVGEAPGRSEDRYGVPFIGPAGDALNEILLKTGFKREDIYVTNTVKCRPTDANGKDRTPTAKEIKACHPYLLEELRTVKPRYVVALGGPALKALTGATGISSHRNSLLALREVFDGGDTAVVAAIHPAAALHNEQYAGQTEEDLRFLRRTIDDDFVEVIVPWEEARVINLKSELFSFDCEASGLVIRDPFYQIYFTTIDDGTNDVQVSENDYDVAVLLRGAIEHKIRVVGHNSSAYDRLAFKKMTGVEIKCDDTILMAWLLHEEWGQKSVRRLNLQALCTHYLGVRPWKQDVTWDWGNPTEIPWADATDYGARDTRYTRMLAQPLMKELQADGQLWNFYDKLMLPASRFLADMGERGIYVSQRNVAEAKVHYTKLAQETLWELQEMAAGYGFDDFEFNPGSTQQVAKLLFDEWKLPIAEMTPGGKASTNVGVMKQLRQDIADGFLEGPHEFFDKVLQYRRYRNKMLGTYIAHYEEEVDYWNMAYPWTSLTQTVTGRTSSPWQQIPRPDIGPMIRRGIAARPGEVLIEADFSQLEMRVAASRYIFDEPNLRQAFGRDDDVHTLLAAEINNVPIDQVTKKMRQDAKPINFLCLYGGEEQMIVRTLLEDYDLVKPLEEARRDRDAYFRRWNGLPAGHQRVVNELLQTGQVRTLFGTLRRLPSIGSGDQKLRAAAAREAVNVKVQGPACHMALIGGILLGAAGFEVIKFDHDAYLIRVEDSERVVRAAAAQIRELLERGVPEVMATQFGIAWDVPLKVELKCGTAWTEGDRNAWVA